ncbi:hypothetical protein [Dechloromonas denitrificans]|uniref:hypothetical protein n=1 Tax=Dechloromonas denitrificans TaxID=281362 RepID=UPI001CFB69ED|nr:hypothetical protein [Dechloromonas denitrificans]UCV09392.1 hypothetical protein KI615_07715 [Dechloromonas denitrificans]
MEVNQSSTLLGHAREVIRYIYLSIRTERCYVEWVYRFVVLSYRADGLGQPVIRIAPHECCVFLGSAGGARQAAFCAFFRPVLGAQAGGDIRQALLLGAPVDRPEFPLDSWPGAA